MKFLVIIILIELVHVFMVNSQCIIPKTFRSKWFYLRQNGSTTTEINQDSMSGRGKCIGSQQENSTSYFFWFQDRNKCNYCVNLHLRTINVIQKIESGCLSSEENKPIKELCKNLNLKEQPVTMFSENYEPISCRSSISGIWTFKYKTSETRNNYCDSPRSIIRSCQHQSNALSIVYKQFNITYGTDPNNHDCGKDEGDKEYLCLGDWRVNDKHYFAVVNAKESRNEEKYRCMLIKLDENSYMGMMDKAECPLSVEKSQRQFDLQKAIPRSVTPYCQLPSNFSGEWINAANREADVFINDTHIVENLQLSYDKSIRNIYVCITEMDKNRYMMERITDDGCETDYICFVFLPRHHNIIRFRKGRAMGKKNGIDSVCQWSSLSNPHQIEWSYSLLLNKKPYAVQCPITGEYKFEQKGNPEEIFETKVRNGVTDSPRPNVQCKENISAISICQTGLNEMWIDENRCETVDSRGAPLDIYREPDYKFQCIGYWKENLKSYMVTYNEKDAFPYRCWVYELVGMGRIHMSQARNSFCELNQDVSSWNITEGAAVVLQLTENEKENGQCPSYYNDGSNPWLKDDPDHIQIFDIFEDTSDTSDWYTSYKFWIIVAILAILIFFFYMIVVYFCCMKISNSNESKTRAYNRIQQSQ